jgi:hypothetical protein
MDIDLDSQEREEQKVDGEGNEESSSDDEELGPYDKQPQEQT